MKVILILSDTVNKRFLPLWGGAPAHTPNLERLAGHGTVFDSHFCGSAPCMPARRDILTGRLNFLEKPWGGMEPFDVTLPGLLKEKNVFSSIVTDHVFYLNAGGENYLKDFSTWEVFRGQEHDPWALAPNQNGMPSLEKDDSYMGEPLTHYRANRTRFHGDERLYPTPRTFQTAADFVRGNKDADNYFLWVEGFDPHEPYDAPEEYVKLYGDDYDGPEFIYPRYGAPASEYTEKELRHLTHQYLGLLTMTDKYIGKLLDALDETNAWKDTMVVFTTDHGFMLGEKNYLCKNFMPAYNEVFEIPMIVSHPRYKPARVSALTQNIDLFPTILEFFGVDMAKNPNPIHGKSLLPLLSGEAETLRDAALYGYFGKTVNVTDGRFCYLRAAARPDNAPLFVYTAMPTTLRQFMGYDTIRPEDFCRIAAGPFLPWTDFPVFRFPGEIVHWSNWSQNFEKRPDCINTTRLYDCACDPEQLEPVEDAALHARYERLLVETMVRHDAPLEQYERLGL